MTPPPPRIFRPVLSTLRFIIVVIAGCAAGLASAWWAINEPRLDFAARIGGWTVVSNDAATDPYSAARLAREGAVGLGPSEGLVLAAATDSDGRPLRADCVYRLAGPLPEADLFTLTLSGTDGRLPVNPAGRAGYSSYDLLRFADDEAVVLGFGPDIQPGNFITVGGLDGLRVTYRLYGQEVTLHPPEPGNLPVIHRQSCREGAAR